MPFELITASILTQLTLKCKYNSYNEGDRWRWTNWVNYMVTRVSESLKTLLSVENMKWHQSRSFQSNDLGNETDGIECLKCMAQRRLLKARPASDWGRWIKRHTAKETARPTSKANVRLAITKANRFISLLTFTTMLFDTRNNNV